MKALKHIAAACAAVILISSCSIFRIASNASTVGSGTGSALSALYKIFKTAGSLDLSDLTTLINLGKILVGANSLNGATEFFTDEFTNGLISNSSNLINSSNAPAVINALKSMSAIDTSVLMKAATDASDGKATQITNSTQGAAQTLSALNGIFNLLD